MKNLTRHLLFAFALILISSAAHADTFARTTASQLNVRTAPDGDRVIGINKGTIVAIIETSENWAKVMYLINNNPENPQTGWVSAQYLQVLQTASSSNTTQVAGN